MNRKVLILLMLFCCSFGIAQEAEKSELQQRAEAANPQKEIAKARSLYIHAYKDYASKGRIRQGVECAVKAAALYYKENLYQEAFDLLRGVDQTIVAGIRDNSSERAALQYLTTKERMQMYIKMRRSESAKTQLNIMETQASLTTEESVKSDLLYNKAIYYYTFGQNAQGNAVFKEMEQKLTAKKEYDKVDEVYQTLIANGRKSNSASLVAQSYRSYMAWKDSVSALKTADEIGALKQQIADNEASIADKDSSLTTRQVIIVGLCILAAALAAALVIGAFILLRYIVLSNRQKKTIGILNDSNVLKAKFISNISAQLEPTLQKLDSKLPEVKALLDFSAHIQKLSELEETSDEPLELKDTKIPPFCEALVEEIRGKVKSGVTLTVNVPNMTAPIHQEYVTHILRHLLNNAALYTPEGGTVTLDFKKRGPHAFLFMVSDTGCGIPEENVENVFKPFLEVRDLTTGDGLGLPICRQMAMKMKGDLTVDTAYTKGARFVLDLHA